MFTAAAASIRAVSLRPEVVVSEIPAPGSLAPYSLALAADLHPTKHAQDGDFGTGRFIVLYDPSSPEAWGGVFRVICYAQAPLDTEMGVDPFVAEVAWSWLIDGLDARKARYHAAAGTATKMLSTGFGELESQGSGAQLELRASWTPAEAELGAHVEGWGDLLCMLAGLPPEEGVSLLSAHRAGRE